MPFPDDLEDMRAKMPLGRLSHPVRMGIIIAVACVVLLAISGIVSTARDDFAIDTGASSSSAAIASEGTSGAGTGGSGSATATDASASGASSIAADDCQVYVVGSVKNPGVYRLPVGSRVEAAIEAAGGFKKDADTTAVNLARVIADGEQITVPAKGETVSAAQGSTASNSGAAGGKVNINTATSEELQTLDGVGESTAAKIIASRESEGPFTTIEDLKRVSGIGDKKFAAIASNITV
jgi:competence protein ComEA